MESTFQNFYSLEYQSNYTTLDLSGFSIGFEKVRLSSDTTRTRLNKKFATIFFEADEFQLNHIAISQLLFNADIDVSEFVLRNPNLTFLISKNEQNENQQKPKKRKEQIIKEIEIGKFILAGGSATFVEDLSMKDTLYSGEGLAIELDDIDIPIDDNGIVVDQTSVEHIDLKIVDVLYAPDFSPYRYQMKEMSFDYQQSLLTCHEVALIPKETLLRISNEELYQKTVFDVFLEKFEIDGIQLDALKNKGNLLANKVTLSGAKFSLLRNANHPLSPSNKQLMHRSLVESTFPIDIDSVIIAQASIDYRLVPKGAKNFGQVKLEEINGTITGIQGGQESPDTLNLYLESQFMAHGKMAFSANFPLDEPSHHYYFGHISALPFEDLNAIITPMVGVQLNQGKIEDLYFTGECSDKINTGEMIFDYDNLKLQVNNKKTGKKKWLLTDIGNIIVNHNSKKNKDGRSKAVNYQYERPPYQGHIGFYLNGLLDGMMKNLLPKPVYSRMINGLTPKTE